ncbi:hypothetical protein L228DRAFT_139803 [Xylona heveae TC161]|uniref:Uncharacterized protein n=1 Tax=Xylona heveae (strain CBS 132557 / TC161) TaxID=1328760 RepID=A0A165H3H4_XYLHT|nr:hypothetical protein L228DRAFT_139803 [Xylona heveae TC161]KZF22932.1 hypothetical protein L228DRAFT_139803 [Xylona heveae TC161]
MLDDDARHRHDMELSYSRSRRDTITTFFSLLPITPHAICMFICAQHQPTLATRIIAARQRTFGPHWDQYLKRNKGDPAGLDPTIMPSAYAQHPSLLPSSKSFPSPNNPRSRTTDHEPRHWVLWFHTCSRFPPPNRPLLSTGTHMCAIVQYITVPKSLPLPPLSRLI